MSPQPNDAAVALPGPGQGGPQAPPAPQPEQSPAPAQQGQETQMLDLVRQMVSASRMLGKLVPGAVPIVEQINDLVQKLQMKIMANQPGPEPKAPPM